MGGWPDQVRIRLTSASTGVGVEVGAELGNSGKVNRVRYCLRNLPLIFAQRLTLFFLLYSRNHLDDVIFICRAGVPLAAQTTSWDTDCIGKSYGGSNCRI